MTSYYYLKRKFSKVYLGLCRLFHGCSDLRTCEKFLLLYLPVPLDLRFSYRLLVFPPSLLGLQASISRPFFTCVGGSWGEDQSELEQRLEPGKNLLKFRVI